MTSATPVPSETRMPAGGVPQKCGVFQRCAPECALETNWTDFTFDRMGQWLALTGHGKGARRCYCSKEQSELAGLGGSRRLAITK